MFLDEIADLGFGLQAKLLRVLQEKEVRRVGGNESFHVDVRLVAATNRNLAEEVAEQHFREDLYYRVNVVTITLPPLRDAAPTFPNWPIISSPSTATTRPGASRKSAARQWKCCSTIAWPGNIRQLESAIERAVLLCDGDRITPRDLPAEVLARKAIGRGERNPRGIASKFPPKESTSTIWSAT